MGKRIDLTGRVFDSLEVISYSHTVRSGHSSIPYWLCRCECGTEKVINGNTLKSGRAKCCGKGSCRGNIIISMDCQNTGFIIYGQL